MNNQVLNKIISLLQEKNRYRKWRKAVVMMAAVVVFTTTYALILPALTAEAKTYCGKQEHTHTDDCYTKELICNTEENEDHTHSDECYETKLTCEQEEHTHTTLCYSNPDADVEKKADWEKTIPSKLSGNWDEDLVSVAKSQVGYKESQDNYDVETENEKEVKVGYTRYGDWYGKPYAKWNALFVDFCLNYANIPKSGTLRGETASDWLKALKKQKSDASAQYQLAKDYTPQAGDLIFIEENKETRVGIVTECKDDKITVIEGDIESNKNDIVAEETYKLSDSKIQGYVHPDSNKEVADEETEASAKEVTTEASTENTEEAATTEEKKENTLQKTFENDEITITASYKEDANIPENAEFVVKEIKEKKQYNKQKEEAIQVVNDQQSEDSKVKGQELDTEEDSDDFNFLLYDISFVADGKEIEPESDVSMKFELKNQSEDATDYQVVHFADKGTEVVKDQESSTEDGTVTIDMTVSSFSEYGVLSYVNAANIIPAASVVDTTSVEVNKEWMDGEENHTKDSVTVRLYMTYQDSNGNELISTTDQPVYYLSGSTYLSLESRNDTGLTVELNAENDWTATFENLPAREYYYTYSDTSGYIKSGSRMYVTYTVEEENTIDGYTSLVTQNPDQEERDWKLVSSLGSSGTYVITTEDKKYAMTLDYTNVDNGNIVLTPVSITDSKARKNYVNIKTKTEDGESGSEVPLPMIWRVPTSSGSYTLKNPAYFQSMVINSTSSGASLTTSHSYASVISVASALDSNKQYYAQIYNGSSYFKNNNNESVTLGDSSTASNWRIYRLYFKTAKHSYTITNYDTDSTSYNLDELKLEHHKSIDALRDNIELKQDNPDTTLDDSDQTDLTDLYRLYLDITGEQTPVDVLFVLDQSESMNTADMDGSTRIDELLKFLNGDSSNEGFISKFLDMNKYNRYAIVGFGSPGDIVTKEDGYMYTDDAKMRRAWGRDKSSIVMDAKMIGTNYDAALMKAADMFEGLGTTSDEEGDKIPHKRIMIFLSDGVPSVYITENGDLNGDTDTALYSDNAKASAASAKLHFNEFLKNNLDVETYSVAFYGSGEGYSFDTSVLEYMAKGGGGVYKHVSDSEELEKFMEGICMPNNVSITDTLSDYVDYYSTQPDLKVVMTEKETGTQTVLYDYDEKTKTGTWDKNYIKGITVDGKKVELEFVDDYRLKPEYTYTLSFNVETTQQAYNEAAANRTEGDRGYKGIEGDPGSDYGQNQTSSEKEGFYSNKTAIVTYNIEGITKSEDYEKPVIQVADGAIKIKKVNMTQTDKTLSGAVFDLYRKAYTNESGVSVSGLSGSYVKVNTQEIKTGNDGMVEVDHLPPNTYYLVETEAPIGYDKMTSPQSFTLKRKTVTVPTGSSYITGETVTAEIPTLTVGNNPGLILPNTGGSGTTCYLLTGIILMLGSAGIYILMRRKGDIYS